MRWGFLLLGLCSALAQAAPEVIRGDTESESAQGVVFHDRNGDGRHQPDEPGIANVMVSNGLDLVRTDEAGRYALPWRADMDLFVIQPAGWRVAQDHLGLPQIHYSHRPEGTAAELRYGGLAATGPAPQAVNFPLYPRSAPGGTFRCAVIGDSQTYNHEEVGFFRDSTVADLLQQDLAGDDCLIYVGDVVGDNLDLLERLFDVASVVGVTQWPVLGNHDIDLDATDPADATSSWRDRVAPAYYAFEIGNYTFVALNNVLYSCAEPGESMPESVVCAEDQRPSYNGRLDAIQMQWLSNLISELPAGRTVVLLHHIPMVSITNSTTRQHQTDQAPAIYERLAGREALSISGHTHSVENLTPGESYKGWKDIIGVEAVPFRHLIAGAASGSWWMGDFDTYGVPMALMRMGAPRGVMMMEFSPNGYREQYLGARLEDQRGHWIDLATPGFRRAIERIFAWQNIPWRERGDAPLTVHDLDDTRMVTPEDLAGGTELTVNVWLGGAETRVIARINNGEWMGLARTQRGRGEAVADGVEQIDPFAAKRQITVARHAIEAEHGTGYQSFQGRQSPTTPQPQGRLYTRNAHLWRARLPTDLPVGSHVITVRITDRFGRTSEEKFPFEVRAERPYRFWQEPEKVEDAS